MTNQKINKLKDLLAQAVCIIKEKEKSPTKLDELNELNIGNFHN